MAWKGKQTHVNSKGWNISVMRKVEEIFGVSKDGELNTESRKSGGS